MEASGTSKVRQYWSLPLKRKLGLLEAATFLTLSYLMVRGIPFRWYYSLISGNPHQRSLPNPELGLSVQWAMAVACLNLPWESTCLMKAIAARWMLGLRRQPTTLFLGTRKSSNGELDFHAWLTLGEFVVCGHFENQQYTVIHTLGSGVSGKGI